LEIYLHCLIKFQIHFMKKISPLIILIFISLFSFRSYAQAPSDLFISEYIEGSSNNKAIELYNGTGSSIDLAAGNYVIQYYFNGATTVGLTITLTGTVANNDVFVLAQSAANATILAVADQTNSGSWYNGDDAIVLRKGGAAGTIIDAIGQIGFDPGTEWGTGLTSTADNTLRRKAADCAGDIDASNVFDPTVKYNGFATDDFTGLGSHTSSCTASPITITPGALNFSTTAGTPSAQQTYTVQGTALTNDIIINIPAASSFGISLVSGGPYTASVTIPFAAANAGPVNVYVIFSPSVAGTQSGNITHVSGAATSNLSVQGVAQTTGTFTQVYIIQGSGAASPLVGTAVTTEGIVTADYQGTNQLNGFYIQDTTGDANTNTSDGIFIFNTAFPVSVGDYVRVTGTVAEFFNLTEITTVTAVTVLSTGNTVMQPANVNLPVAAITDLERYEGMLVKFPQTLTATETFTLGRFGEVSLSVNGRLFNPTNFVDPNDNPASGTKSTGTSNIAAVTAQQDLNNRSRILLDDASSVQNPPIIPFLNPADTTLRIGSTIANLTGILSYDFSEYRLQPTVPPVFNYAPRTSVPSVGNSNVKVASFNVLNYFNGDGLGGGFPTSRGADSLSEFIRQRTKIIKAISSLNADAVGLIEIENDGTGTQSAIADLVNGLNAVMGAGTYAFVADPVAPNGNTGTDEIKVAIIYKPSKLTTSGPSKSDINPVHNRPPLAQTFTVNANGEKFTLVVNHFKSKSCTGATGVNADQGDGQGCYNSNRKLQAQALLAFISSLQTSSGDADVISVGDYNAYEEEDPMDILLAGGLTNVLPGTYSYVFDGQSGSLDNALVTSSLLANVSGAGKWHINADEPIAKSYDQQFNPPYAYSPDAFRSSDHDPVLIGLNLQSPVFTLQILHASDFESGGTFAPNFAAIIDTLEGQYPNTVLLSSGDNWIPSPFYNASSDRPAIDPVLRNVYNQFFGPNTSNFLRAASGRADVSILNILGFQASALGNHEFDAGTSAIADIIGYEISGTEIRWMGAQFPFLSANLNFGGDASLSPLFTNQVLANTDYISRPDTLKATSPRRKIAPSTIINVNGQQIGVVGATTQILESISSTGGVTVKGSKTNNMAELATYIQPVIDSLTARGINKIILLSHLQQIAFEKQLVGLLNNVDIVIAGGSSTLLSDGNDVLRPGDVSAGTYPFVSQNANGQPALVVNTDQEYKYVGRLVLNFDNNGVIQLSSLDSTVNGVYATTDQTVINLWGNLTAPFAAGTKGNRVKTLVDGVNGVIIAQDGNIVGKTNVYLEGRRIDVRTQETNLGNLSADANTSIAKIADPTVKVSIKNGGGIRTSIGEIRVNPVTNILEELPPQANPLSGKLAGEVSQLDVANSLRFNNSLSLVTVTASQLLIVLNHAVAATAPGATPGQFAQVGGVKFSFNPSLPAGSRVRNAVIIDSNDNVTEILAVNGVVQGDSLRPIRVVTLSFLLTGGDNYPFNTFIAANPSFANRVDLVVAGAPRTGNFVFADNGSEQDAFAEYMKQKYGVTPYNILDTDIPADERIQNLSLRGDSVLPDLPPVITITTPLNNTVLPAGSTVTLTANATDADGTITKVEFYNNGVKFATDSTAPYTLTGTNVEAGTYVLTAKAFDNSGDSALSTAVTITLTACTGSGSITGEGYTNIPGTQVANLIANPAYPNNPSVTVPVNSFEYANAGNDYGARLRGYICAPLTGDYTFYIAGDDQAGLWLSTDENPNNKTLIAYNETPVAFRAFTTFATQKSVTIHLVKGVRYYIETLHKQSAAANHLSVAWVLPNGITEAPIPGSRLSPIGSVFPNVSNFQTEMEKENNNIKGLKVTAMPNPSVSYFVINTKSISDKPISVTVMDITGRIVERKQNIAANGTIQVGNKLGAGVYFVEVIQGTQKQRLKLVKQ
jgi:predicted extracellular nuclease/2',3'-cyclic-nucleotide 2'-phosphodiesterase (5'-nucleotidase family)